MEQQKDAYNHLVLKKHDPALDKLIFTSSICDVYEFNTSKEEWEQTNYKGSLFLYSRIAKDDYPYSITVLNRNDASDFSLGITPALRSMRKGAAPMVADLQDNTLMIQVSPTQVYGLWLFEETDRQKLLGLVSWCIQQENA